MSVGQRIRHIRTEGTLSRRRREKHRNAAWLWPHCSLRSDLAAVRGIARRAEVPAVLHGSEQTDSRGCRRRPTATLEHLAQATTAEGTDAAFLLQLKPVVGKIVESDRTFLLDCACKLVAHQVARLSVAGRKHVRLRTAAFVMWRAGLRSSQIKASLLSSNNVDQAPTRATYPASPLNSEEGSVHR